MRYFKPYFKDCVCVKCSEKYSKSTLNIHTKRIEKIGEREGKKDSRTIKVIGRVL